MPVGANCQRPDYDYADGVKLLLHFPDDGCEEEVFVTDVKGSTVMKVRANRAGGTIKLRAEGRCRNFTCEVLGEEKLKVVLEE